MKIFNAIEFIDDHLEDFDMVAFVKDNVNANVTKFDKKPYQSLMHIIDELKQDLAQSFTNIEVKDIHEGLSEYGRKIARIYLSYQQGEQTIHQYIVFSEKKNKVVQLTLTSTGDPLDMKKLKGFRLL